MATTSNKTNSQIAANHFSEGDIVVVVGSQWLNGASIPTWVTKKEWIVKESSDVDGKVVIDKSVDGSNSINSPIHYSALTLVKSSNNNESNSNTTPAEYAMKYSVKNPPLVCMQTQSTCYKGTSRMSVKGILWHSTGANNNTLKRYVQPSDNDPNRASLLQILGKNPYNNDWNHTYVEAGLNAWVGILADGTVTSVQTMPWDYKPWGCGAGSKGSCNNGWIQFEICEDNLTDSVYFEKAYREACELTAYLCKLFNLDPHGTVNYNGVQVPVILCHADSCKLGLGSDHSDVYNWFPKFGKSMTTVRNDVEKLISGSSSVVEEGLYLKGLSTQLSKNFDSDEFDCQGNGCCSTTIVDSKLVKILQDIRDHFGKPLDINSGYRCEKHNKEVGGVVGSKHTKGQAADIVISGITPLEIARYAESIGVLGIGLYETDQDGHFVHIDTRDTKSFWYGQSEQLRDTFQEKVKIDTSKVNLKKADPEYIWNFFREKGLNEFATAGIMGNLFAESSLLPINLQNSAEKKLGMTDAEYTAAVDQGIYKNFVHDGAGYGLAQWTYYSLKEDLLRFATTHKASIGDACMQLEFLWTELTGMTSLLNKLQSSTSVQEASNLFLHEFERPADQSEKVELSRASYGLNYYNSFACKHANIEVVNRKDPSCTETGYTGDKVCSDCGFVVSKGEMIPELGHEYKLVGKVDPTVSQDGYTGDKICSRCGHTIPGEVIDKIYPDSEDVTIVIKKSWIKSLIEWLQNLLK